MAAHLLHVEANRGGARDSDADDPSSVRDRRVESSPGTTSTQLGCTTWRGGAVDDPRRGPAGPDAEPAAAPDAQARRQLRRVGGGALDHRVTERVAARRAEHRRRRPDVHERSDPLDADRRRASGDSPIGGEQRIVAVRWRVRARRRMCGSVAGWREGRRFGQYSVAAILQMRERQRYFRPLRRIVIAANPTQTPGMPPPSPPCCTQGTDHQRCRDRPVRRPSASRRHLRGAVWSGAARSPRCRG